ncbi:MAG: hypothetical protein ABJG41_12250 [Cyclobacteriaceae bacterium]
MRNDFTIFIAFVLFTLGCKPTDSDSPLPEDIFVKYYGLAGQQEAIDIIYNEDEGQYMILASQTLSDGNTDFYFITADQGGNFVNSEIADFVDDLGDSRVDVPARIKQISATEYLVVGTSTSSTDESKIVWKVINHNLSNAADGYFEITDENNTLEAADIIQVAGEDNVVILGTTSSPEDDDPAVNPGKQLLLTKRDLSNTRVWRKSMGGSGDDEALSLFEMQTGNLALFGSTSRSGLGSDGVQYDGVNVLAIFTNSLGTPDGAGVAYGFSTYPDNDDVPSSVIRINSDFRITGTSSFGNSENAFIMGINRSGTLDDVAIVPTVLETNDFNDIDTRGNTLVKAFNGDYLVMGSYPSFDASASNDITNNRLEEMMILRTDANGNKLSDFDQWYGLESGNDRANKAINLPDGKIAVVGTFDFGSGTTLIGLLKLNINGELRE